MDLEEETKVLERRVRRRLNVEIEAELYMTCDGRRLTWPELAETEDGKTVEVLLEMRRGTKKKRKKKEKNQWNSSESSSGVSEPERVKAGGK